VGNQYLEDSALRDLLKRIVSADYLAEFEKELEPLGWRIIEEFPKNGISSLKKTSSNSRKPPAKSVENFLPRLKQYNAWGR